MNISKKHEIIKRIYQDLNGPERYVCCQILCFLLTKEAKKLKHITYNTIITWAKLDNSSSMNTVHILKATDYLSSSRLHLLHMQFQFIENENSEPIPVDNDDVSLAIKSGVFYHPETGEILENFNNHLFPYFVPTEMLGSLHE